MALLVKDSKKEYTAAPEGLHSAVCVDVVDLGEMETQWGAKHKIEIRWVLEVLDEDGRPQNDPKTGKPFMVTQRYTASLAEKSKLRPMLEAWRGRKFSKEELEGFDVEKLVGVNCQLQVVHNIVSDGGVYSNVQAVVPAARGGIKLRVPTDYIRVAERERRKQLEQHPNGDDPFKADDSDIPF